MTFSIKFVTDTGDERETVAEGANLTEAYLNVIKAEPFGISITDYRILSNAD